MQTKKNILSRFLKLPYHIRVMSCIVVSELILIGVFIFWPKTEIEEKAFEEYEQNDIIAVEEIVRTRQESAPPPPPKPQIPQPVPNDEVIEEEIIIPEEIEFLTIEESPFGEDVGIRGEGDKVSSNPQRPPNVIKIVEPALTPEAKSAGLKAEIFVTFLVNRDGTVEDAFVSEIRKYSGDTYTNVEQLGYGVMEAALEAALKWKFRPARDQGSVVRAYTTHVFSFGF